MKSALKRVKAAVARKALDRSDRATVRLDREHEARPHRFTVELDRAGAADALLAADLRARQTGRVADEVRQDVRGSASPS